ncbi:MAG TPA: hypothetical protein VH142_18400 [Polyangiaceae bacterium]|jgi:hypothetical protein|nr:hypothetical protein [Polyangiaceae bacterium]
MDCDRGTVTVEYVVLLSMVAVGAALLIAGVGGPLLSLFRLQRDWLLLPIP